MRILVLLHGGTSAPSPPLPHGYVPPCGSVWNCTKGSESGDSQSRQFNWDLGGLSSPALNTLSHTRREASLTFQPLGAREG